jgi:hypothetical protein
MRVFQPRKGLEIFLLEAYSSRSNPHVKLKPIAQAPAAQTPLHEIQTPPVKSMSSVGSEDQTTLDRLLPPPPHLDPPSTPLLPSPDKSTAIPHLEETSIDSSNSTIESKPDDAVADGPSAEDADTSSKAADVDLRTHDAQTDLQDMEPSLSALPVSAAASTESLTPRPPEHEAVKEAEEEERPRESESESEQKGKDHKEKKEKKEEEDDKEAEDEDINETRSSLGSYASTCKSIRIPGGAAALGAELSSWASGEDEESVSPIAPRHDTPVPPEKEP